MTRSRTAAAKIATTLATKIASAMRAAAVRSPQHFISFEHHDRPLVPCCTRARCTCGWWSDSYASFNDARRASDVHLRRVEREEFDARIARCPDAHCKHKRRTS